jgi:4-hydroxy-2-oxoheptanedioate aldolase
VKSRIEILDCKWRDQAQRRDVVLRAKLKQGQPVLGTFVFLPSPAIVEMIGLAGFDFAIIDMEHSPKDWSVIENMVRAAQLSGVSPLIRVAENNEKAILHALEVGAEGVMVPFIQTGDDAKRAARAARYAPVGNRGVCTLTRAAEYGRRRSEFETVVQAANENVVVIGLIEDSVGVENIDDVISASPGIDVVLVGRADLASAAGVPGQVEHSAVLELVDEVITAAERQRDVRLGIGIYSPAEATRWLERGFQVFAYSADTTIISSSLQDIANRWKQAHSH